MSYATPSKIDILRMVSASGFTSHHQSLYAAILLRDGVVVHDEHETADRYVAANTWVLPYCPGFAALRQHGIQPSRPRLMGKRALEWLFSAPVFDGAERMVYHWWRRRWERDRWAVESPSQPMVATPSVADFHSYYWEDRVLSGALERFAALGLLPSVESSATCAQTQVVGGEIVALTATPGRFGTYTFTVELMDASGAPSQGAVVDLQLNMPDMQMGSLRVHLAPVNPPTPGAYQAQGVLSMKGQWQAVVQIVTPGATQPVQATFRFPAQYY
jgi:hypothetical protein